MNGASISPPTDRGYYAIAFRKDDTALRDAVADTLAAMMEDGTYQKILETWHLTTIAVPTVMLNGAPRG